MDTKQSGLTPKAYLALVQRLLNPHTESMEALLKGTRELLGRVVVGNHLQNSSIGHKVQRDSNLIDRGAKVGGKTL